MKKKAILYIHGKGGNAEEALHYEALFPDYDIIGLEYTAQTPWDAKAEFPSVFDSLCGSYEKVTLIANSIGAFFAMQALNTKKMERAFFISPIVNMEKLIADMMQWANVSEADLQEKKEIPTSFGETLSWEYLRYVRAHPLSWSVPTHILYAKKDHLTSFDTIASFAQTISASLTVMENGEHWFHTAEQMDFLDRWIKTKI